jgi:hypothetical protein
MKRIRNIRSTFSLIALACIGPQAAADPGCTAEITAIPITISAPGTYCVAAYLATALSEGAAIEIQSDDVTIDMSAGGGLDNLAAGTNTTAMGIHADDRNRITVRGGAIRGFRFGISIENSAPDFANTSGHRVTDVLVELSRQVGIEIRGEGTIAMRNLITNTGVDVANGASALALWGPGAYASQNRIVTTSTLASNVDANAIFVMGAPKCHVVENQIVNTEHPKGFARGVMIWQSPDCKLERNEFDNNTAERPLDVAIYIVESRQTQAVGNKMGNALKFTQR